MRIAEAQFVTVNDTKQWVTVRGTDISNPILVFIGGPGAAFSAAAPFFAPWEQRYTLVQWDQPGAGATAMRNLHMMLSLDLIVATYDAMRAEITSFDARRVATKFGMPMLFFHSEHDAFSVTSEVEAYAAEIEAPASRVVIVPGGGHSCFLLRGTILELLDRYVRPFLGAAGAQDLP